MYDRRKSRFTTNQQNVTIHQLERSISCSDGAAMSISPLHSGHLELLMFSLSLHSLNRPVLLSTRVKPLFFDDKSFHNHNLIIFSVYSLYMLLVAVLCAANDHHKSHSTWLYARDCSLIGLGTSLAGMGELCGSLLIYTKI